MKLFIHPVLAVLTTTIAAAQWSGDPAANFAAADAASDQAQSKLAPTSDGGTWLTWFDGIGSGWDVRVQKLDLAGNELFAHNGLLVADRSFSSTQDYGLDVSSNGDALIAFRDDRPSGTQITVAKVTSAGGQPWGAAGVVLTSTGEFVANPKVAGTSDGGAVVAWIQNSSVKLQKLDSSGSPEWGAGVTLTPGTGSYSTADLHDVEGETILSMVHQTGGFSSPKHLVAQKFDANGAAQWGANPIAIFNGGSLQFGNFPSFTTDDSGGAVFSWYSSSPSLQCFAQRVDASGNEMWPHNGVALATTAGNLRVNPTAVFDPSQNEVIAAWKELNGTQSQYGVRAQRLDAAGNRLWTADGTTLVALSTTDAGMARPIVSGHGNGALVVWAEAPSFGTDRLYGAHVAANGAIDVAKFDVASTPSTKSRLQATTTAAGFGLLSWGDERSDAGDIYVQNLAFDGTLGAANPLGTIYCSANLNSSGAAGSIAAFGSTVLAENDLNLHAVGLPSGKFGYFLMSQSQGFIPLFAGSQGNFCLGSPVIRFAAYAQASSPQGTMFFGPDLTNLPQSVTIQSGDTWNFQLWFRDNNPTSTSNTTDGVSVNF